MSVLNIMNLFKSVVDLLNEIEKNSAHFCLSRRGKGKTMWDLTVFL